MNVSNDPEEFSTCVTGVLYDERVLIHAGPPPGQPSHAPQLFGVPLSVGLGPNRKVYSAYGTPITFAPPTPLSSLCTSVHAFLGRKNIAWVTPRR